MILGGMLSISANCGGKLQWPCPPQQQPQLPPEEVLQQAPSEPPLVAVEAKTLSFLASFFEPQWGHCVPSQFVERTRISLSLPHSLQ